MNIVKGRRPRRKYNIRRKEKQPPRPDEGKCCKWPCPKICRKKKGIWKW